MTIKKKTTVVEKEFPKDTSLLEKLATGTQTIFFLNVLLL